jgi:hypothetical protein
LKKKEEEEVRPKRTTVQDMRAAAEEIFGKDFNLDKRLCRLLMAAMKLKFKTLERFREYCENIRKSKYIRRLILQKDQVYTTPG